jgi:hypothetical protein
MTPEQEFIRSVEEAFLLAVNRHQSKDKTFDLLMSRLLLISDTYYAQTSNQGTVRPTPKGTRTHPT